MSDNSANSTPLVQREEVAPPSAPRPCGWHECENGHIWPPMIAIVQCGACKGPIVAVKVQNCPICNEPITRTRLRVEHTSEAMGFPNRCMGQQGLGHAHETLIDLKEWHEEFDIHTTDQRPQKANR